MSTVVDNMIHAPLEPPGPCAARTGRLEAGPDEQHPARAEGISPHALTTATLPVADDEFELDDRVPNFYDGPIPNDIARRAWVHLKSKATDLAIKSGFDRSSRDDILAELWLDLLRRWPKYDPTRSPPQAFVASVALNRIADIMAGRVTHLREQLFRRVPHGDDAESRRLNSLNKPVGKRKRGRDQRLGTDAHERRTCVRRLTHREQAELEHDVTRLLAKLPNNERRICEMLMKFSPAETARRLGMAESTFRDGLKSLRISLTSLVNYVKRD
jgi:RNA polymerase sigma-70 factor (ECF subfamily)